MEKKQMEPLVIENAKIIFKNFSGNEKPFNPAGKRNFCVIIESPDDAKMLAKDGWNVKQLKPREKGDDPTAYIQVAVDYSHVPPKVWVVSDRNKTLLTENEVDELDYAIMTNIDLEISPYQWFVEATGKSGVKAYLKTMYATVERDRFADKYDFSNDSFEQAEEENPFNK